MVRFRIDLDSPEARLPRDTTLSELVRRAQAAASPGQSASGERVAEVIRQGSVWLGKRRVKDPELSLAGLRGLAAGLGRTIRRGGPVSGAAPVVEVFWPEKPISEYTIDPRLVIWEDASLLVVWKPAGLNTCQSVFSDTNCMTWGVQKLLDARNGHPSDPLDTEQELPGRYVVRTINRLDYATRGLVFYAKDKDTEKALHQMFMERRIHKRYLAGTPAPAAGRTLPASLVIRDPVEWQGKVQDAVTLVRLLGRGPLTWWWAVLPQTGRTHQIRKHFAARLLPIEGDITYGTDAPAGNDGSNDPDSLLLACVGYRFRHPVSGQTVRISRQPPEPDFAGAPGAPAGPAAAAAPD